MHSCSKIRADNEVIVMGIYCTTILQKYDFKAINSNELFYVSTLRNFYILATEVQLQCSLAVQTDFVTSCEDSGLGHGCKFTPLVTVIAGGAVAIVIVCTCALPTRN